VGDGSDGTGSGGGGDIGSDGCGSGGIGNEPRAGGACGGGNGGATGGLGIERGRGVVAGCRTPGNSCGTARSGLPAETGCLADAVKTPRQVGH
jgi:hypothetical protein